MNFEMQEADRELKTLQVSRDDVLKAQPTYNEVVAGVSYTDADNVTVFFHRKRGVESGHGIRILTMKRSLSGYGENMVATWAVSSETFVPTPSAITSRRGGGYRENLYGEPTGRGRRSSR